MIRLEFTGWFQCRLATDPDPHDERRGISGYVQAYANEPDLDRFVHWQAPPFTRPESPSVGVSIKRVTIDAVEQDQHPLLAARVALLDGAKFEGRNGVIAEDGEEPIYPFHLSVESAAVRLQRHVVPANPEFPYREFFASGLEAGPDVLEEIRQATGVSDLSANWKARLERLQRRVPAAHGAERVGLEERIAVLSRWLESSRSPSRYFGARMLYDYALRSHPNVTGWTPALGPAPSSSEDWRARFWLGGWDADALCGFCSGSLEVPTAGGDGPQVDGTRGDDRDSLMVGERRR